ncbi:hypothetical protein T12_11617, partial [Trichinella patagoniensis]
LSKLSLKLERQELTAVLIAVAWATSDAAAPTNRQPTGTQSGRLRNRRVLVMAVLQAGNTPCVNGKLNGTMISLHLDTGAVVSVIPKIEHAPAPAGQLGISAAVSANSRRVRPHLGAGADKPGDWARALVGGAECSRRSRGPTSEERTLSNTINRNQ